MLSPHNIPLTTQNEKRTSAASSYGGDSTSIVKREILIKSSSTAAQSTHHFSDVDSIRPSSLPQLNFSCTPWKLASYIFFVIFCNLALPCMIYYLVDIYGKRISFQTNIGISSASLGLSSCFDAPFRLYHLTKYRKLYGPLGDDVWWHGDFFMWMYTFALFSFAFPLAIAPALTPVAIKFFLMSTAMLIQPFGVTLLFTLARIQLPIWCSSTPPGAPIKPGAFYVMEDLGAVDFREGRAWRAACHDRYDASPPFRSLMLILTWYWIVMTCIYTGVTAAVTWATSTNFAFAFVLGQLFIWLALASLGSWGIVHWGLRREREWWNSAPKHVLEESRTVEPRSDAGDAHRFQAGEPASTLVGNRNMLTQGGSVESETPDYEMRQTNLSRAAR